MAARKTTSKTTKKTGRSGSSASKKTQSRSRMRTAGKTAAASRASSAKASPSSYFPGREERNLAKESGTWLLLAVCAFLLISYFGIGGYLGQTISDISFGCFGMAAWLLPFLLFLSVSFLTAHPADMAAWIRFFSGVFFYIGCCSFIELVTNGYRQELQLSGIYMDRAVNRSGGGVVGATVAGALGPVFGMAGTVILLLVLMIICIVLMTQKSLFDGMKKQGRHVYQSAVESGERRRQRQMERDSATAEEVMSRQAAVKEREKTDMDRGRTGSPVSRTSRNVTPIKKNRRMFRKGKAAGIRHKEERELEIPVIFSDNPRPRRTQHRVSGSITDFRIEDTGEPDLQDVQQVIPRMPKKRAVVSRFPTEDGNTTFVNLDQETKTVDKTEKTAFEEEFPIHMDTGENETQDLYPFETADEIEPAVPEENDIGKEKEPVPKSAGGTKTRKKAEDTSIWAESNGGDTSGRTFSDETPSRKKPARSSEGEIQDGIASVEQEMAKAAEAVIPEYVFPPLDLLVPGKPSSRSGADEEVRRTASKLQQTLDSFGVHAKVTNVNRGPAVTRYELLPEQGVKVSRIVGLADDIKLNLAAADIRIEAPIPGKSAVGIEVPNEENSAVMLRDLLDSPEFKKHTSKLAFATGKDIGGRTVVSDIAKMPHVLIAGATGSGKSVCINTIIMSILYKARPDEVKLIMIDPKVVELSVYNGIPHLLIPVVTDPKKASGALNWGVAEMMNRYNLFAEMHVRDIRGYNQKIDAMELPEGTEKPQKLPQILIIVDELADLMMVAPGEVEDAICRLAQLARAAGIHLVIATQRPSVNVITGLIKANMPSRISFAVTSGVDSRTILDMTGAEKLLGKGDMLFYPQGYQKPARVQGAFVSDEEVAAVVDFLKDQNGNATYNTQMQEQMEKLQNQTPAGAPANDSDDLFADAARLIIKNDKASIGMLQRAFKIGFNRAARIMDQLSEAGIVGPDQGTKPRKILMSMEELENKMEQGEL